MQDTKSHSKHFLCFEQMADIGSRIPLARRTSTAFLNWALIQFIFCVEQIQLAMVRVDMAMSSIPGWVYTVKNQPHVLQLPVYSPVYQRPSDRLACSPADTE